MDQTPRQPEPNSSRHDGLAQLNDLAQTLTARARWPGAVLSPWVQRALREQAVQPAGGVGQPRPTALSEGHTRVLVQRAERHRTGSSRVWQPDVGSVAPATFGYFAGEIVERHRPIADKYRVQSAQEPGEESELPLAPGGQVGAGLGMGGVWPEARPTPSPPLPPATVQGSPARPRTSPTEMRSIQAQKPVRQRRDIRPMSRVEEITPGSKVTMVERPEAAGRQKPMWRGWRARLKLRRAGQKRCPRTPCPLYHALRNRHRRRKLKGRHRVALRIERSGRSRWNSRRPYSGRLKRCRKRQTCRLSSESPRLRCP
jgi:hypothetical protein